MSTVQDAARAPNRSITAVVAVFCFQRKRRSFRRFFSTLVVMAACGMIASAALSRSSSILSAHRNDDASSSPSSADDRFEDGGTVRGRGGSGSDDGPPPRHHPRHHRRPELRFRSDDCDCDERRDGATRGTDGATGDDHRSCCSCFKILQIADIHLGEAESSDWGPEQDRKTFAVLDSILREERPNLIVLSGDQLTGNDCRENATAYYRELGEFLSRYEAPWATIFGNHDDMGYVDPDAGTESQPPKFGRRDLLAIDQSFALSLSQGGPSDVFGTSNYALDVLGPSDGPRDGPRGRPAAQIFLLDSGGGSLAESIDSTQLRWLQRRESALPAVAFQHIPTESHRYSSSCSGFEGEEQIAALERDAGIVTKLVQAGRFLFLAVGHNHGNDYCCPYDSNAAPLPAKPNSRHANETSFHLCFGRHSGYGGYGAWERGARVYDLRLPCLMTTKNAKNVNPQKEATTTSMTWKSWVRLESGAVVDRVP